MDGVDRDVRPFNIAHVSTFDSVRGVEYIECRVGQPDRLKMDERRSN